MKNIVIATKKDVSYYNLMTESCRKNGFELIVLGMNKSWEWGLLSLHPNITMEFIEKYPDKSWNWSCISKNSNITMDFIEKHPDKPWSRNYISTNPNISIDFIEKHIDKINFRCLSRNKFTYENKQIKRK